MSVILSVTIPSCNFEDFLVASNINRAKITRDPLHHQLIRPGTFGSSKSR